MMKSPRQNRPPTPQAYYHAVLTAAGKTREALGCEVHSEPIPTGVAPRPRHRGNGHSPNATPRVNGASAVTLTPLLKGFDPPRSNGRSYHPEKPHALAPHTMTIGEFLPLYERNHVALLKSHVATSQRVQRYLGQLAGVKLGSLTKLQVLDWFHAIAKSDGPHAANHFIEDLHSLYVKAEDWDVYMGKNPAQRIKKFPKHSRERFVQSDEMPRLLAALAQESPSAEAYFLCLLLTGARRGEARTMKWSDLDLDQALWHKPTTKTGVPHTVPLAVRLIEKLRALPRVTEWVFPSTPNSKNGFQARDWSGTAIEHRWRQIRKRAQLSDVRIHDLRRSTASWLAISGANLPVIQRVLNHSSLISTQVYARLSVAPVRRALDEQAERMLGLSPSVVSAVPDRRSRSREALEWPG